MQALIIIDMLNDFFRSDPLAGERRQLSQAINDLVRHSRENGVPIVWVRQEFQPDLSDAFLVMRKQNIRITIAGTDGCELLSELDRQQHDHEIVKKRYSAFYQTALQDLLAELGAETVVLAGINTHACIRTAAIDAYQRDLNVVVVAECVSSYDRDHHDMTLRYLGKGIANITSLSELKSKRLD